MFAKGSWSRRFLWASVGGAVVIGGGTGIIYQRRLKENRSISAEEYNAKQDQKELETALKNLFNKHKEERPLIKLYRYTTCPFCGTVKAFLDYYKIPHELVEVEPMFKSQIGPMEYKKVPQLQFILTGHWGPMLVDSSLIVTKLAAYVGAEKQLKDDEITRWREWARDELVRFLVLNINISLAEAWASYSYIDEFDTIPYANKLFLKVMGAPAMYMVAKLKTRPQLIKAGHMKEGDDVHEKLFAQIARFAEKVDTSRNTTTKRPKFHGGNAPDLADIDVYGVLQSIRGHKIYDDIFTNTEIGPWMARMDEALGKEKYIVHNLK